MTKNLRLLLIVLCSVCVFGCVGTNDQPIENPIASSNTESPTAGAAAAGKTKICHFNAHSSTVIVVGNPSLLPAHFSHGDCTTDEPKGTKGCSCGSPASITIIKDAQPNGADPFSFTATGQVNQNFSLTDNGAVGPDRITFSNLTSFGAGNTVTITEAAPVQAYSLVSITCSSNTNNNNSINVPARSVTIQLEQGESVTCTFVNAVVNEVRKR